MSDELHAVDRDDALAEVLAGAVPATRGRLLRTLAAAGLIGSAGLASAGTADATSEPQGDVGILNYALTLEYLQSAFYTEVERIGAVTGEAARLAGIVGNHEREHVRALLKVLGSHAVPRPSFDFRGATESRDAFVRTAVVRGSRRRRLQGAGAADLVAGVPELRARGACGRGAPRRLDPARRRRTARAVGLRPAGDGEERARGRRLDPLHPRADAGERHAGLHRVT